jgi:hypothetical protein
LNDSGNPSIQSFLHSFRSAGNVAEPPASAAANCERARRDPAARARSGSRTSRAEFTDVIPAASLKDVSGTGGGAEQNIPQNSQKDIQEAAAPEESDVVELRFSTE